jgi:phosphoglycolate phosphatase
MNIKAIIFDLDGTLIDSLPAITIILNQVFTDNNLKENSSNVYRDQIGYGLEVLIEDLLPENMKSKELAYKMANDYRVIYNKHWKRDTTVYPGVIEILDNLQKQKMPIGILTNKSVFGLTDIIKYFFPTINFQVIKGREKDVPMKPDPTGAINISKTLDIDLNNILFVGDTEIDIQTAKNANMLSCGVLWGYRDKKVLDDCKTDIIIKKPEEILNII